MTYHYILTHYSDGNENIIYINDARCLLDALLAIATQGIRVEVIDGFTGEVLCAQNCPDPYMQDAFGLMVLGRLTEKAWG